MEQNRSRNEMMVSVTYIVVTTVSIAYLLHMLLSPVHISRPAADGVYDYVIVGGGSAGAVVASRLTEDPDRRVLLLEAGDDDTKYKDIKVPMKAFTLWGNEEVDWLYTTTPQKHACLSMKNRQCSWPRGKVLGGCSSINGMIYIRGHPKDFDLWAKQGCDGWDFESVLPYFIKSENNKNPHIAKSEFHGISGPQVITDCNSSYTGGNILLDAFMRAGLELGYAHEDINGEETIGTMMHNQVTIEDGQRQSVSDAFLRPVATTRPNLHILTKAHVTKIRFDGTRATGVEYRHRDAISFVSARREVVLSAGTVSSAQLLMLSGVGPKAHLESMGIPVVADLPVGQNLQDHLLLPVLQYTIEQPVAVVPQNMESVWEFFKYKLFKRGVHASPIVTYAHAFDRSMYQPADHNVPYIKLVMFGQLTGSSEEGLMAYARTMRQTIEVQRKQFGGCANQHGFHIFPVLLHPMSRGNISLKSNNPFDKPLINPEYLSNPLDVRVFVDGIRMAQSLGSANSFTKLGAKFREMVHPECTTLQYDSDSYWECVVRHMSLTEFHPVGTCRMGNRDDPRTVVDPTLRVKGLDAFRVIDCSIIPEIISGNTNAATVMIAEKGSDLIKDS